MMSAEHYMKQRDQSEAQLAEIANLVCALEIVSWQLAQISAEGEMAQLRDAVVGISRAMNREIQIKELA